MWLNALAPGRRLRSAVVSARFAAALALTMQSGLNAEESLEMSLRLVSDAETRERLERCRERISSGESFIQCISQASIFSIAHCRMLSVGFRTGSADAVMAEIARRCEESVQNDIDSLVARVEPTLVIIMTGLVGSFCCPSCCRSWASCRGWAEGLPMRASGVLRRFGAILRNNLLAVVLFAVTAALLTAGLNIASRQSAEEEKRLAEESVRRAVVSCYAIEGRYPESYAYIRDHYGVRVNEDKYCVDYRIFASNIMPDISIWEVAT